MIRAHMTTKQHSGLILCHNGYRESSSGALVSRQWIKCNLLTVIHTHPHTHTHTCTHTHKKKKVPLTVILGISRRSVTFKIKSDERHTPGTIKQRIYFRNPTDKIYREHYSCDYCVKKWISVEVDVNENWPLVPPRKESFLCRVKWHHRLEEKDEERYDSLKMRGGGGRPRRRCIQDITDSVTTKLNETNILATQDLLVKRAC